MKKPFLLLCIFAYCAYGQQSARRDIFVHKNLIETVVDESVLGVDLMHGNAQGFTILPNPANDHILISVGGKTGEMRHVTVTDLNGRSIITVSNRRENTFLLNVSALQAGIYSIQVVSGNKICRKKWAKR